MLRIAALFLCLFFLPLQSFAAVLVTNAIVNTFANDTGQGDDNIYQSDPVHLGQWSSSFSSSASEGRVIADADFMWESTATGFQLDMALSADIGAGLANGSAFPDDAASNVQMVFTVTAPVSYQFVAQYSSEATSEPDGYAPASFLWLQDAIGFVYQEGLPNLGIGSVSSSSYTYGTNPSIGSNVGTLAPGTYRIDWETHLYQFNHAGGATGDASFSLRLGEFAAVPAPAPWFVMLVGLLGVGQRRVDSRTMPSA